MNRFLSSRSRQHCLTVVLGAALSLSFAPLLAGQEGGMDQLGKLKERADALEKELDAMKERASAMPAAPAKKPEAEKSSEEKPSEEKPGDDKSKSKRDKRDKAPERDDTVETDHVVTAAGQRIAYRASAGTLTLRKAYGEPLADVFHVSYIRTGEAAGPQRPVCFCFNGGPGSSSVWLHMGAFGPQRVNLPEDGITQPAPPYSLTPNEYTLLGTADLVFVDPVSTGYSQPEKGENPKQFHGFNEDVESIGEFIRLWLGRHNRWTSPKYLMGESYGAIRVSGLASHLQDRYGMNLNGVIIVSGLLDFKTLSPDEQNDVAYLTWLPSMTAVAHHHKKLAPEMLADFPRTWARVRDFVRGDYARALLLGSSLSAEEREKTAAELSALTSLPRDWIIRQNLRISPDAFRSKLMEAEDLRVGRFDGRVRGQNSDPSLTNVFGAFSTLMNIWLRDEKGLNYRTDKVYEILNGGGVQPWNYGRGNSYFSVTDNLTGAMNDNPALRVFIACGYHDMATPPEGIDYSVRHMDIPDTLRKNISWGYYEGGHMMYTTTDSLSKLSADVKAFLQN